MAAAASAAERRVIYTFTGTGNSLWLARQLAAELGEDVEVAPLLGAAADGPPRRWVGLVYPVYVFTAPRAVSAALARLPLAPDAYVFAVANPADMAGAAVRQVEVVLARRGQRLAAGYVVRMPSNYTPFGGAESAEKQEKKFSAARANVARIAADVRARRVGVGNRGVPPLTWLRGVWQWLLGRACVWSERRFVAEPACTGCGLCVRLCPVANIVMEGKRPRWQGHCEQCYACLQFCPVEAIQCGKATRGRVRYHHPEVTAQDLIAMREAASAGRAEGGTGADGTE